MADPGEVDDVGGMAERYARRGAGDRYGILRPHVWQMLQERQRAEWRLWARLGWPDLSDCRWCEVGCGAGGLLLEALRSGVRPEHLTGLELLPERLAAARQALPSTVILHGGDAVLAPVAEASQDVVAQHTVFSSLLDDAMQQRLADAMWRWARPGGGVLWYDFQLDNPRNPDVRGVPLARVKALFPQARRIEARRLTLAPPLARAACRVHPALYTALNSLALLRTHLLCWIPK